MSTPLGINREGGASALLIGSKYSIRAVGSASTIYLWNVCFFQVISLGYSVSDLKCIVQVLPLAITNFDNIIVVAACASFLELCGLPAQLLQVDVAALSRISSYINNHDHKDVSIHLKPQEAAAGKHSKGDMMKGLVQGLAEEYTTSGTGILSGKLVTNSRSRKLLMVILQLLENASLSCDGLKELESNAGAWLMNGVGDGAELRAVQRSMSERWSLVTAFCRGHQLPLSTTYLATIARFNDWVTIFLHIF